MMKRSVERETKEAKNREQEKETDRRCENLLKIKREKKDEPELQEEGKAKQ